MRSLNLTDNTFFILDLQFAKRANLRSLCSLRFPLAGQHSRSKAETVLTVFANCRIKKPSPSIRLSEGDRI